MHYYIHIRINTLEKGMNSLSSGLIVPFVLYKDGFVIKLLMKVDIPLNGKKQTEPIYKSNRSVWDNAQYDFELHECIGS